MHEILGLGAEWDGFVGNSTCCESLRTRVRIPSIQKEKPHVWLHVPMTPVLWEMENGGRGAPWLSA